MVQIQNQVDSGFRWQRLSETAKRVIIAAQEEAQARGQEEVEPEHLLLALCGDQECVAFKVLRRLGVDTEAVREEIERGLPPVLPRKGDFPCHSARLKQVRQEACSGRFIGLSENFSGTEHILAALLRVGDGQALELLAEKEVTLEKFLEETASHLNPS